MRFTGGAGGDADNSALSTSRQRHNAQMPLTRVELDNVLDEGLRIRRRGRRINSKVKIQINKAKLDVY
jgi:hypothetical protein